MSLIITQPSGDSATMSMAISLMAGSPAYADITAADVLALSESARLEGLTELPDNSVSPRLRCAGRSRT